MTETVIDRRTGTRQMIRELLGVRDRLLALYRDLADKQALADEHRARELLERFCQALIDYAADTHFRLYRYIDERRERRQAVVQVADRVYGAILETTDDILEFNDRYDFNKARGPVDVSGLEADLSRLGERLADRIELEDQVIAALQGSDGRRG